MKYIHDYAPFHKKMTSVCETSLPSYFERVEFGITISPTERHTESIVNNLNLKYTRVVSNCINELSAVTI